MRPGPNEHERSETATFCPNHFETSVTSMVAPARKPGLRSRRPPLLEEHHKPRRDSHRHDDDDRQYRVVTGALGDPRMGRAVHDPILDVPGVMLEREQPEGGEAGIDERCRRWTGDGYDTEEPPGGERGALGHAGDRKGERGEGGEVRTEASSVMRRTDASPVTYEPNPSEETQARPRKSTRWGATGMQRPPWPTPRRVR